MALAADELVSTSSATARRVPTPLNGCRSGRSTHSSPAVRVSTEKTDPTSINILGKDYLTRREAAHYACVSLSNWDTLRRVEGIPAILWGGKRAGPTVDDKEGVGGLSSYAPSSSGTLKRALILSAILRESSGCVFRRSRYAIAINADRRSVRRSHKRSVFLRPF